MKKTRAPGGGRKPQSAAGPKQPINMKLAPDVLAFLRAERERTGVSVAQQVEQLVKNSYSFKK